MSNILFPFRKLEVSVKKLLCAVAATAVCLPALAANAVVYSNDFSVGAGSDWSSPSLSVTPTGEQFLGEFGNSATTLTLTNLAAHNAVTISFDLYVLKTWDGDNFGFGPDVWGISVNGNSSFNGFTTTFSNGYGPTQSYPSAVFVGSAAARTGSVANDTLGYGSGYLGDSIYHLTFTTSHSASTFTATLFGTNLQGISDESWGIDNVSVAIAAVPEPESYAMLIAGLGLMGAVARRRRIR